MGCAWRALASMETAQVRQKSLHASHRCLFPGYFAPLIFSVTHWSTTFERLSSGRLLAPCSVSIQHCSAALDWVSGGGAASTAGVPARLAVQPASIIAANTRRPKRATLTRAIVE